MRRTSILLVSATALLLAACGGSPKTTAGHTASSGSSGTTAAKASSGSTAASGPARSCRARAHVSGGRLVVTVTTDGEAVIYAADAHANPSSVSATVLKAPWVATLRLNDAAAYPVKVSVYGNRQETTCTATAG